MSSFVTNDISMSKDHLKTQQSLFTDGKTDLIVVEFNHEATAESFAKDGKGY